MTFVLLAAIALLLVERFADRRRYTRERATLLNAALAKDVNEFRSLEREKKPKRERPELEAIDFPTGSY